MNKDLFHPDLFSDDSHSPQETQETINPPNRFFDLVTGKTPAATTTETTPPQTVESPPKALHAKLDTTTKNALPSHPQTTESALNEASLPHEARRVLVYLLRQGTLLANQKRALFEQLCRFEKPIRQHLHNMYMSLTLDHAAGVAFVANSDEPQTPSTFEAATAESLFEGDLEGQDDHPTLITQRTLTLYDTLLLLVLRKHYQDRAANGEQKIILDIDRVEAYLTPFLPLTDSTSLDRKKLIGRLKEMVKRKLLATVRGVDDRYEITPVIRYVVNAEFLSTLLADYQRLAKEHGAEQETPL